MAAAATRLTARTGDTLDALLWREAALGPSALGAVLAANPGLADLCAGAGAALPAGTVVSVPAAAPQASTLSLVNLWD